MNAISEYLKSLQKDKALLVNNLNDKGVTASDTETFTDLVPKVAEIPSGEATEPYYITFFDYDGTELYKYTLTEIKTLAELPTPVDHTDIGFTFKEWNWSLEALQELDRPMHVGAVYVPTDGTTKIVIEAIRPNDYLYLYCGCSKPFSIDWGDGTIEEVDSSSSYARVYNTGNLPTFYRYAVYHEYKDVGTYTISVDKQENDSFYFGNGNSNAYDAIVSYTNKMYNTSNHGNLYDTRVIEIHLADDFALYRYCMTSRYIKILQNLQLDDTFGQFNPDNLYSLSTLIIPKSISGKLSLTLNAYCLDLLILPEFIESLSIVSSSIGLKKGFCISNLGTSQSAIYYLPSGIPFISAPDAHNFYVVGSNTSSAKLLPVKGTRPYMYEHDYKTTIADVSDVTRLPANTFANSLIEEVDISHIAIIDPRAFQNSRIKKLTIPDGIAINSEMLLGLHFVEEINCNSTLYSLSNCFHIKDLSNLSFNITGASGRSLSFLPYLEKLPTLTTVSSYSTFPISDCPRLKDITLPAGTISNAAIKSLGIENATFLSQISSLSSIVDCPYIEELTLPNISFGSSFVIQLLPKLKKVDLSACTTITTMYTGALAYNNSLATVLLPPTLKTYPQNFLANTGFTTYTVPVTITSIGGGCFGSCSKLEELIIESEIPTIPSSICADCYNLKRVVFPSTVTKIDTSAFANSGLETFTIPANVTQLGNSIFSDCPNLTTITIEGNITSWGSNLTWNADKLTTVNFAEGMTNINLSSIARGAKNLKTLTIPSTVTSMAAGTTSDMHLRTLHVLATEPPIFTTSYTLSSITAIYVPDESVEAYKAAPVWLKYADKILPASSYVEETN